jgi:hypothetical protein
MILLRNTEFMQFLVRVDTDGYLFECRAFWGKLLEFLAPQNQDGSTDIAVFRLSRPLLVCCP